MEMNALTAIRASPTSTPGRTPAMKIAAIETAPPVASE
jgi:hypothetical protein